MEAKARQTDITMPARKLRRVINLVRGKSADDALSMLKFMPYFAARVVEKNLTAAVANATEKGAKKELLKVSEIYNILATKPFCEALAIASLRFFSTTLAAA